MDIMTERTKWPIWQCLSGSSLAALADYQLATYNVKPDFIPDPFSEVESLEELKEIMQGPLSPVRGQA